MTLRVTQEGRPRGSGDQAVLMIYEALWLLPAPRGRSPEGAAWARWVLCSFVVGIGLCFLPLRFPFSAFLLQSEQLY